MRARNAVLGAALVLAGHGCAATAGAQSATSPFYKVVAAGQRVKIAGFYAVDPTCRSLGATQVSLQSEPHGGRVELLRGNDFPNFAQTNVRFACDRRRVPATLLFYRASANFTGDDSFDVEAVYPEGSARRYHYNVSVR